MSVTTTYPFTTPANYIYNSSLIEVTGGVAKLISTDAPTDYIEDFSDGIGLTFGSQIEILSGSAVLANLETLSSYVENFNDSAGLTFNATDIEIVGGTEAALKLQSNPGQNFTETFSSSTGFTYNASNTEFTGGLVRQIQKAYRPTYYLGTFFANYDTNINGNYGNGVLTGTGTGSPTITGGKLDLTGGGKYVTYNAISNANSQQYGCIRFKYTPEYTGAPPATNRSLFSIHRTIVSLQNVIFMTHNTPGNILLSIYDSAGIAIINNVNLGAWAPTSGTEYEFELNWDITNGATRLFINGNQFGATQANVGVRDSNILLFNIGAAYNGSNTTGGYFNDVQIFDYVQHTANYTPSAYGLSDPKQPIFYAGYGEDVDGDWGDGVLTGTAVNGASVSGGELILTNSDVRYVEYTGLNNFSNATQTGCIRLRVKPNYTGGAPSTAKVFFQCSQADSNSNNEILIFHQFTTNFLVANIRNSAGVTITTCTTAAPWLPTAGTTYEIEYNYNITTGDCRLFVDGTLVAPAPVVTGTRNSSVGIIRIGSNTPANSESNHSVLDVLLFNNPQHVTNYTPDWTGILPYEYYGDTITLPEMEYTGAGTLVSFDAFPVTETNAPRYTLQIGRSGDYLYWDGGAWAISNNTYTQANPSATFAANLATLPILGEIYGQFRIYTQNNIGTQQSVNEITASLTAQIYSTSNPVIDIDLALTATATGKAITALNSFTETTTEAGSDLIKYTLSDDNGVTYKYWDGGAWSVSSGYVQSNTGAEINTNIASFPLTVSGIKIRVYLHSNTGVTTPAINNLAISYDDYIYSITNPAIDIDLPITATVSGQPPVAWNSFTETTIEGGSDLITYVLSDDNGVTYKWWNGGGWVVSSGYAESNNGADVNTNIASFPLTVSGMKIKVYLHSNDGSTTPSIANLVVNYDDYIYSTSIPTIYPTSTVNAEGLIDFTGTINVVGSDNVRFTISVAGVQYYWNGSIWTTSNGTYAQTSAASDIDTNASALDTILLNGKAIRPIAYLYSFDGSTTPELDEIVLVYDLRGALPGTPLECIVFGFLYDQYGSPIVGAVITAQLGGYYAYNSEIQLTLASSAAITDASGYWEMSLIETENMNAGAYYTFKFFGDGILLSENRTVPNQASENYVNLTSP